MGMWRCMNLRCADEIGGKLGHDFEAEAPVCPNCKTDAREERFKGLILKVEVIHYDPPHPTVFGYGLGHIACDPNRKPLKHNRSGKMLQATGHKDAVTCQACRETEAFKAEPPDLDLPLGDLRATPLDKVPDVARDVEVSLQAGMVRKTS